MESKQFDLNKSGLSEKQISEHIKLYDGYCKKIDEIRTKISVSNMEGNATYSDIRELKVEEGFCINAIKLHELFFENIGQGHSNEVIKMIESDFGSLDIWKKEFTALAMSSRGWVVLAYDWKDDKLHNYICDVHNQGAIWETIPLLILDVYEHAYFIDHGTNRKAYVGWFMDNINWRVVEGRTDKF